MAMSTQEIVDQESYDAYGRTLNADSALAEALASAIQELDRLAEERD